MRLRLATFTVLVSTLAAFAQSSTTNTANDKIFSSIKADVINKVVSSGTISKLSWFYDLNPDCSSVGGLRYRILKKPNHGEVDFADGEGFPEYYSDNARFVCNSKKAKTLDINYKSTEGFIGEDRFEVMIFYTNGNADRYNYIIIVE